MVSKQTLTRIRNSNAGGVVYTSEQFRRCQLKPICMRLFLLLSVSVWQLSAVSLAAPVTFNIDPGRSTLVLSGNGLDTWSWGSTDDPIVHSGLATSYAGTIVADRDADAGTFQITRGDLVAQNIPGFAFGPPNDSPGAGNYLFFTPLTSVPNSSSTFQGAIRDFSFSLSGPVLPASTSFDASQLTGSITTGRLDWAIVTFILGMDRDFDGSSPLAGDLVLAPGLATLVELDGLETLTIPIGTDFLMMAASNPTMFHLSGNIIATRAVPEPHAILGLLPLVLVSRHRRRSGYNRGQ